MQTFSYSHADNFVNINYLMHCFNLYTELIELVLFGPVFVMSANLILCCPYVESFCFHSNVLSASLIVFYLHVVSFFIIDCVAGEIIRLVASVCVRVCPSVCLWALTV